MRVSEAQPGPDGSPRTLVRVGGLAKELDVARQQLNVVSALLAAGRDATGPAILALRAVTWTYLGFFSVLFAITLLLLFGNMWIMTKRRPYSRG